MDLCAAEWRHLIFLEFMLPEVSGLEISKRVRAHRVLARVSGRHEWPLTCPESLRTQISIKRIAKVQLLTSEPKLLGVRRPNISVKSLG